MHFEICGSIYVYISLMVYITRAAELKAHTHIILENIHHFHEYSHYVLIFYYSRACLRIYARFKI